MITCLFIQNVSTVLFADYTENLWEVSCHARPLRLLLASTEWLESSKNVAWPRAWWASWSPPPWGLEPPKDSWHTIASITEASQSDCTGKKHQLGHHLSQYMQSKNQESFTSFFVFVLQIFIIVRYSLIIFNLIQFCFFI